ncbi:MAG TPA: glycosyltransferase family 2 protein [Candidatus Polarisedimenticolia bacterium]|nr:glycosyltransferase family 2 protein [Candidatus Polarisedimenticolia bacterium]
MISVIIPALDEAPIVGQVVRDVLAELARLGQPAEVLVADDGSTDDTARCAEQAGATVLRLPRRGKGLAVRAALQRIGGDRIVLMDSDGQDVPVELAGLLAAYESSGADFVNGSRFLGTFRDRGISSVDYWGNRALTGLANLLCGCRLSDINASYRVIRRVAVEPLGWSFEEFEIESEMILKASRAGLKIVEVPVTRERRLGGVRKFRKVRHGLRILMTILKVRFAWSPPVPAGRRP